MRNTASQQSHLIESIPQTLDELSKFQLRGWAQCGRKSDIFAAAKHNIMAQIVQFQNLVNNFEKEVRCSQQSTGS